MPQVRATIDVRPTVADGLVRRLPAGDAGREDAVRVHLGPEDAQARGIRQGDRVRVFNSRGELFLPANLDLSLARGCVVAYNGYGGDACVNRLSRGRETDMGHGAAFHDNLVDVEKAP